MYKIVIVQTEAQSDESEDVLIITADGLNSIPTDVQPFDPNNDTQVKDAKSLMYAIENEPDKSGFTVVRLAYSYGGMREWKG